jgi:hypothetical protein
MCVLIMSDMEGVSGIVTWSQVTGGHLMYEEGRKLYTGEINAAVRGAKRAGATEIVAVDCHGAGQDWSFNSFVPELLVNAGLGIAANTSDTKGFQDFFDQLKEGRGVFGRFHDGHAKTICIIHE